MPDPRTLNPGSDEALTAGCQCPVIDNAHGVGYMCIPGVYVKKSTCPLHGLPGEIPKENGIRPQAEET